MIDINYVVYKTTNLINNKIYIGVHKQSGTSFDGYLGSGKLITKAIAKYGKSNFHRETLYSFDSEIDAYNKELELVTKLEVTDNNYYNMKEGGIGGGLGKVENLNSELSKLKKIQKYGSITGMLNRPEIQAKAKETCRIKYGNPWGATHTKESKLKELDTKVRDAHRKHPELNKLTELYKGDTVEFTGTLYEILVLMFGTSLAVTYRGRIIHKISRNSSFNSRSKWKGYYVRWKLT